jgi:mannose PTS system EIIC component
MVLAATSTPGIGIALLLAIWAYIGIVTQLGPGLWWTEALVAGFVTGVIVGNIPLSLTVGATLTLLSLGLWTYGGATIPDFQTGAIVGTAIGAASGSSSAGIIIGGTTAVLMTQADVLARGLTTVFIHGADRYANDGDERGLITMHFLGQIPWGLSRAIPVFIAVWLGSGPINAGIKLLPTWATTGLTVAGAILPALGFALLLTMLPLNKYWMFLVVGFVLFAYLKMPLIGIAIAAVAIAFLWDAIQQRIEQRVATNV